MIPRRISPNVAEADIERHQRTFFLVANLDKALIVASTDSLLPYRRRVMPSVTKNAGKFFRKIFVELEAGHRWSGGDRDSSAFDAGPTMTDIGINSDQLSPVHQLRL